ncbi:hypothetical protein DFH27DRAFT_609124 [Peziza echinospora]|nr:hypothetical protein DFH27DRAFT_609124 [Peziza echinospora]
MGVLVLVPGVLTPPISDTPVDEATDPASGSGHHVTPCICRRQRIGQRLKFNYQYPSCRTRLSAQQPPGHASSVPVLRA